MGADDIRFSSHASSALAAVSIALILLYVYWRFIWQIKKQVTSTGATTTASPSPTLPSCRREGPAPWRECEKSQSPSTLPLFVRVEVPREKADCAVCLAELGDGGAAARLVPGCGHGFHVACIEAWFRVNSTCPLCRAAVAAV